MKDPKYVPAPAEDDIVMPKSTPAPKAAQSEEAWAETSAAAVVEEPKRASDAAEKELAPLPSKKCEEPACGMASGSWAGRQMWTCAKCGFETFTKATAEERAGRAL